LTVLDVEAIDGPLDAERLGWVADLYGAVDPRYRRREFLDHLFAHGPAGPALHAFAVADGEPVAHAAVIPTPARHGSESLRAGKLEALYVAESHRGRRSDGVAVVRLVLDALYDLADARRYQLIHAFVVPRVGKTIGFTRLDEVAPPSLVALMRSSRTGAAAAAERALTTAQLGAHAITGFGLRALGVRASAPLVRPVAADDATLLGTPVLSRTAWAVVADGALDWYATSPYVRVLEPGDGSRALVQLPGWPREPLRVAAWDSPSPGLRSAVVLLDAAARLARETGAATLRLQTGRRDLSLRRAARALAFVERDDLTTLWVRTADPALERADSVVPTPFLYLGF
jgi:hypothetical protein